jgi:hypothetical protein
MCAGWIGECRPSAGFILQLVQAREEMQRRPEGDAMTRDCLGRLKRRRGLLTIPAASD